MYRKYCRYRKCKKTTVLSNLIIFKMIDPTIRLKYGGIICFIVKYEIAKFEPSPAETILTASNTNHKPRLNVQGRGSFY